MKIKSELDSKSRKIIILSFVWHTNLVIPVLISFFFPWFDNSNYFEFIFLLPSFFTGTAISGFCFMIIWFGVGIFSHISAALCKNLDKALKKFQLGILLFIAVPFLFFVFLFSFGISEIYYFDRSYGEGGFGYWLFLSLFLIYSAIFLIEFILYKIACKKGFFPKMEKVHHSNSK